MYILYIIYAAYGPMCHTMFANLTVLRAVGLHLPNICTVCSFRHCLVYTSYNQMKRALAVLLLVLYERAQAPESGVQAPGSSEQRTTCVMTVQACEIIGMYACMV